MRDWLNSIFALIGTSSLTDIEYAGVDLTDVTLNIYNQALYDELAAVLAARETVSTVQQKLIAFFKLKDLDVAPLETGKTEIWIGSVLQ